jgi:hypothetical protein
MKTRFKRVNATTWHIFQGRKKVGYISKSSKGGGWCALSPIVLMDEVSAFAAKFGK